jgi:Sec7-like guanine-nucleotide exchange factor
MGVEGFSKICKGINGGKDLDANYLQGIYYQILNKPISFSEHERKIRIEEQSEK